MVQSFEELEVTEDTIIECLNEAFHISSKRYNNQYVLSAHGILYNEHNKKEEHITCKTNRHEDIHETAKIIYKYYLAKDIDCYMNLEIYCYDYDDAISFNSGIFIKISNRQIFIYED